MNRFLHRSTGFNSYATFFYAQLDEAKRQLRYVNAGHNPPYLLRNWRTTDSTEAAKSAEAVSCSAPHPAGCALEPAVREPQDKNAGARIEELATGGMIIGMFPFASYEESAVDLHPGDVLIAFTDGVTEALNPAEEEFGEDRLKELIRRVAHLSVSGITSAISQELRNWISSAPQHDDLTFVVLKLNEPE